MIGNLPRGGVFSKKCSIYSLLKSLHTLLIDTESPHGSLWDTKIPGLCGEYPALPNTAFQRPYSGHVSKRRPAGAWGNWISIGIQQNSFYSVLLFLKKKWSSTDQLAPLEEDERHPFSRASHDHLLWQGFTFVSFNVNLQDHFFCLYACLVGKGAFLWF